MIPFLFLVNFVVLKGFVLLRIFALIVFCVCLSPAFGATIESDRRIVLKAVSLASAKKCTDFRSVIDSMTSDVFRDAAIWFAGTKPRLCVSMEEVLRVAEGLLGSGRMTNSMMQDVLFLARKKSSKLHPEELRALFLFLEEVLQTHEGTMTLRDKIVILEIFEKVGVSWDVIKKYINQIWSTECFDKKSWAVFLDQYHSFITESAHISSVGNMLLLGNADFLLSNKHFLGDNAIILQMVKDVNLVTKACEKKLFFDVIKKTNYNTTVSIAALRACQGLLSIDEVLGVVRNVRVVGGVEARELFNCIANFIRSNGVLNSDQKIIDNALYALMQIQGLRSDDCVEHAVLVGMLAINSKRNSEMVLKRLQNAAKFAKIPAKIATVHYLIGRLYSKNGAKNMASKSFAVAMKYPFTFYGQLAAEESGVSPSLIAYSRLKTLDKLSDSCEALPTDVAVEVGNILFSKGNKWGGFKYLDEDMDVFTVHSDDPCYLKNIVLTSEGRFSYYFGRKASYLGMPIQSLSFPLLDVSSSAVVHSIVRQESCFADDVASEKGAVGFMQLLRRTAKKVASDAGVRLDVVELQKNRHYNISIGHIFFLDMNDRYKNLPLALAAYNAGMGNVEKWIKINGDPRGDRYKILNWIESIPFKETRDYVKLVIQAKVVYDSLISQKEYEVS